MEFEVSGFDGFRVEGFRVQGLQAPPCSYLNYKKLQWRVGLGVGLGLIGLGQVIPA